MGIALLSTAFSSLLLAASPVVITTVHTSHSGGRFAVDVTGEAALSAEAVRSTLSDSRLSLKVEGTRVKGNNRSWGEGRDTVRAHRHTAYVELDVPIPVTCGGPTQINGVDGGGIRVIVACGDRAAPAKSLVAPMPVAAPVPKPQPAVPQQLVAHLATKTSVRSAEAAAEAERQALRAAVALEPEPVAPIKPAAAAARPSAAAAPAVVPASPSGSISLVVIPLLAIVFLGGVSLLTRRRARGRTGLVRILETANLGPKRSLIVARIGSETLVLGSSEAGIALLQSRTDPSPGSEAFTDGSPGLPTRESGMFDDLIQRFSARPQPAEEEAPGQVRFLARLFKREGRSPAADVGFDQMFEDSLEDQELRRKLAVGMEARTP